MRSNSEPPAHHEKFEELAALAAVGELTAIELDYLREHLADCRNCREAYQTFVDLAFNDLGVSTADRDATDSVASTTVEDLAARESFREFRERLQHRHGWAVAPAVQSEAQPVVEKQRRNGLSAVFLRRVAYGLAATVVLSAGIGAAVWMHSARTLSAERVRSQQLQAVVDSLRQEKSDSEASANAALVRSLEDARKDRDALRKDRDRLEKALGASESEKAELIAGENISEARVMQAIADTEKLRKQLQAKDADRERLAKLQQESEAKLHEALAELYQARQGAVQTAANTEPQEPTVVPIAETPSGSALGGDRSSPNEVEARNLFGARNLHIVDVYDVTGDRHGNGQMKRAIGRVYYVEKKLLVFYAFDLQERQKHKRGVFQAWGYHEANAGKPVNMGVFSIDDASVGRWVLTVNRPDVLSHIDAVFVTSEPTGGSTSPRGEKILYANLAWPANHP